MRSRSRRGIGPIPPRDDRGPHTRAHEVALSGSPRTFRGTSLDLSPPASDHAQPNGTFEYGTSSGNVGGSGIGPPSFRSRSADPRWPFESRGDRRGTQKSLRGRGPGGPAGVHCRHRRQHGMTVVLGDRRQITVDGRHRRGTAARWAVAGTIGRRTIRLTGLARSRSLVGRRRACGVSVSGEPVAATGIGASRAPQRDDRRQQRHDKSDRTGCGRRMERAGRHRMPPRSSLPPRSYRSPPPPFHDRTSGDPTPSKRRSGRIAGGGIPGPSVRGVSRPTAAFGVTRRRRPHAARGSGMPRSGHATRSTITRASRTPRRPPFETPRATDRRCPESRRAAPSRPSPTRWRGRWTCWSRGHHHVRTTFR